MKEKTFVITEEVAKRHESLSLTYRLIFDGDSFGISVKLFDESRGTTEERTVRDVVVDPFAAKQIFNMIADGLVTPTTLVEVLEDLL